MQQRKGCPVLTLILALLAAVASALLAGVWLAPGWAILIGMFAFLVPAILLNLWVKKRLEAVFTQVQVQVEGTQEQLRRKLNLMQMKMVGGGKGLQRQMEKEQAVGIREALKTLDQIAPLRKWNLLAERQANTLRAQLCYQIKDFEKADTYFAKCLMMDPLTLAMKMAREHVKGNPEAAEKLFRKGVKRFKDEQSTIVYALYSWILVKGQRIDEAVSVLNDGKDKTEDETIRMNWEHLANGRTRRFSNAGLGDQWYALHMELPKPVKAKQRFGSRKRLR